MELRIAIKDGLLDLTPPGNRRRIMKVMACYSRSIALLGVGRREVRQVLIPCARAWPPYARARCQSSAQRTSQWYSACSRAPERPRRTPPGGVGANPPLFTSEAPVILTAGAALPTRPGQLGLRRRRDSPMQIRPQGDPRGTAHVLSKSVCRVTSSSKRCRCAPPQRPQQLIRLLPRLRCLYAPAIASLTPSTTCLSRLLQTPQT